MKTPLIASLLSLTIAFTSAVPTTAFAGQRDDEALGKFLVGALTLFVLSEAIKKDRKDAPAAQVQTHRSKPQVNARHARKRLPVSCLRTHRTRDGNVTGFGRRCLNNQYRHASRLPEHCKRGLRTNQGRRVVFSRKCLRQNGYHWRA